MRTKQNHFHFSFWPKISFLRHIIICVIINEIFSSMAASRSLLTAAAVCMHDLNFSISSIIQIKFMMLWKKSIDIFNNHHDSYWQHKKVQHKRSGMSKILTPMEKANKEDAPLDCIIDGAAFDCFCCWRVFKPPLTPPFCWWLSLRNIELSVLFRSCERLCKSCSAACLISDVG